MDAVRDLVKEELQRRIRKELEKDEQLQEELKRAVSDLMEAKVREMQALATIGKCGAEIGLKVLPDDIKDKMESQIAAILAREAERIVEKI